MRTRDPAGCGPHRTFFLIAPGLLLILTRQLIPVILSRRSAVSDWIEALLSRSMAPTSR